MAKTKVSTFCRVCEPSCGLLAELEDERLLRLWPDDDHPVTRGFACHKGLGFTAIHQDPDRLNVPLKRTNARTEDAQFAEQSWDAALAEVAGKLRSILAQHGPSAIAGYIGNPVAFNALGSQALSSFFGQLRCRMFSSGTQDCSNKFAGSEAVFGTSTLHPVPDLEHTHYALIFGENPKISHMSFVSMPDPMGKLRDAKKRGATIRFINPRRIESATAGDVVQIKPDTDLYLMAALLHELDAANAFDQGVIAAHGKNLDGLRAFIAPYSAQAVAAVVGIEADTIRAIAREFAAAPSACVHMSTGVNMGRQGTLCYWLLHMLSFLTGNLDRAGGNLYSLGFYPAAKAGRFDTAASPFFATEFGDLRLVRGLLPGNLLADMIESKSEPIRALIMVAGNPLLSVGGGERLRRAFEKLELVVVLDMFRNASGEYADYLLPCCDMLERRDLNICGLGMQHEPFVQYTEAVVPPAAERKEEWWIFGKLEQAMGLTSVFDVGESPNIFARLDKMLKASGLSIDQLRRAPHGTVPLPPLRTGSFFTDYVQSQDKRVDCCPALFTDAIARAHELFVELGAEPPGQLKLINLRTNFMHNSWYHNVEKLKGGVRNENPLFISGADAARLGLAEGTRVSVESAWGRIDATVRIDEALRAGVVAMTHGWGNERSRGLRVASRFPGVNVNALLPSGVGSYEKLSNQAHMTGVPVSVVAVAAHSA